MNLFSWMLVGHLVGDFLLQTAWMAEKKVQDWTALLTHCLVYTAAVALFALPAGGLTLPGTALIFAGHVFIDKRIFVEYWATYVSRSSHNTWLKIVQDQVWHILVLALVAGFL